MIIGIRKRKLHGRYTLNAPADTVLTTAGTFYKISGDFSDGEAMGFMVVENKLVYTGPSGVCFLLNGVSDVEVSKPCEITYGFYINGILKPGAETPHTFPASARTQTLAITDLVKLNKGDKLDVYAKSSEGATTLTARTLRLTLWG